MIFNVFCELTGPWQTAKCYCKLKGTLQRVLVDTKSFYKLSVKYLINEDMLGEQQSAL